MRMTVAEIEAAILSFKASTESNNPLYRRRRTQSLDLRVDPWPKVSVRDQIMAFLTK